MHQMSAFLLQLDRLRSTGAEAERRVRAARTTTREKDNAARDSADRYQVHVNGPCRIYSGYKRLRILYE